MQESGEPDRGEEGDGVLSISGVLTCLLVVTKRTLTCLCHVYVHRNAEKMTSDVSKQIPDFVGNLALIYFWLPTSPNNCTINFDCVNRSPQIVLFTRWCSQINFHEMIGGDKHRKQI